MDVFRIIGIAVLSFVVCMILRKTHKEIAMQVSIAAGIIIFITISEQLTYIIDYFYDLGDRFSHLDKAVSLILKITGICYICEFIVQILKDANENITAGKVEFAGKVIILVAVLPVITTFIDMVIGALQ